MSDDEKDVLIAADGSGVMGAIIESAAQIDGDSAKEMKAGFAEARTRMGD